MSSSLTRNRLTPESKAQLRKTVRGLRASLIAQLKESAEQRYLLSLTPAKAAASLPAAAVARRRRLDEALDQAAAEDGGGKEARARAFEAAAKEAGATLLNRLVLLRHLEALGLSKPAVVTGGWMSKGYREFQQVAPALCEDETQGMAPLLGLLFAEHAVALPGLFGDVGLTSLFAVPAATLREVIEALDAVSAEVWHDDLTLGWVYQYWNDPDREALDAKIAASGKIEPHEIASKTQMFTERYMVEWLLQNSLGPTWLAMCKKHGWTPEVESSDVLAQLDARRVEWRKKRDAGEVAADALMPIDGALEEAWKYYVPQPLPAAVVEHAPASLRELKLLDPACGSGHFLVVAFDLLVELYREEARHRCETWADRQIAEWILENNLHGIDIDPRAVQIAAAAVNPKARALAKDVDPRQVNLVAPALKLSALAEDDAGLVRLEADLQSETGIPPDVTRQLIETLEGVDHLGSLLKVGDAIDSVLSAHEGIFAATGHQRELFGGAVPTMPLDRVVARRRIEGLLNDFLAAHAGAEDLGLRLRGQQLSAGLRFASMAKEGAYHIVVGNPPYQGTSKMKDAGYVARHYPMGKSDLYAAFLERGLQLCRPGGASAMVTMRSWMSFHAFTLLREHLLRTFEIRILADLGWGAFEEMTDSPIALSVVTRAPATARSTAICPTSPTARVRTDVQYRTTVAGLRCHSRPYAFDSAALSKVEGCPVLYWWSDEMLSSYAKSQKLGEVAPVRQGLATGDDTRFTRFWWEVRKMDIQASRLGDPKPAPRVWAEKSWAPTIRGGEGREWFEPLVHVIRWHRHGLELKVVHQHNYGSFTKRVQSQDCYFEPGIAFSMVGSKFTARAHRYRSVFANKGSSVFPAVARFAQTLCLLNAQRSKYVLESLNPGIGFEVGDVSRLPIEEVASADQIVRALEEQFTSEEGARETSFEFRRPAGSAWAEAQRWAQSAVDQASRTDVPTFQSLTVEASPIDEASFAVGVAAGRFGAGGQGVLEGPGHGSLPSGILFISPGGRDVFDGGSFPGLQNARFFEGAPLGEWLQSKFWAHHLERYESRPIYFPLSSSKRSFVAYVSIHSWTPSTLTKLLTDHLIPERKTLEGSLADLRAARAAADKKSRGENDRLFAQQSKWLAELEDFIAKVTQCAEKGPPSEPGTPPREVDAPYVMDLDDGVMVNAAALWPLLEPMWKDPKKWWKELATAKGRKDYDWSHLAACERSPRSA
jgi:hypothetical protein